MLIRIALLLTHTVVQSVKKERTYELNSKFDKTYKFFSKSYHNMISEEIHC